MSVFSRKFAMGAVVLAAWTGAAQADEILQFNSVADQADIAFTGSALTTGAGASGDVKLSTDYNHGVLVGVVGQDPVDTTRFNGDTLSLTGFAAAPNTGSISGSDVAQPLGNGTFSITDAGGNVLLSGSATSAELVGTNAQAGTFSASVTYNGGLLLNNVAPVGSTGSFSFTLGLKDGFPLALSGGNVDPFNADATGDFTVNAVPAPASALGGTGLIGLVGLVQFRRRRAALAQ